MMKEKTEEIELQERTDTQAMTNIDLCILSKITLFYKLSINLLSNFLYLKINKKSTKKENNKKLV